MLVMKILTLTDYKALDALGLIHRFPSEISRGWMGHIP